MKDGILLNVIKISPLCLLDREDFERYKSKSLTTGPSCGYFRYPGIKCLHRQILLDAYGDSPEKYVDHINKNIWDNRRSNLRYCTPQENTFNRNFTIGVSGFKGVTWNKKEGKWNAFIKDKKTFWIGSFENKRYAAIAYDIYAKKMHGDFAHTNISDHRPIEYNKVVSILKEREASKYKDKYYGVRFDDRNKKWIVEFRYDNHLYLFGRYDTEDEAGNIVNIKLKELNLTFLQEEYQEEKANQISVL